MTLNRKQDSTKQKQLWWTKNWTQQNGNESDDDHNQNEKCSELNRCKMMYPCQLKQSPQPEVSQNTMRPSIPSTSKSIYWRPGGGGTACVECAGRGLVVTLGLAKSTTPELIKSCIAWWSAEQRSVSCPGIWWYKQCSYERKWWGIGWGKGLGAKGTITPASLSFSKALVKVMPKGVNCPVGLYAYGLGGGWVVALGCEGRGCMLVWAM